MISGMTESIVAAAASRIGKRVLHLDRYTYVTLKIAQNILFKNHIVLT